ncbi:MAG: GIY-YIG nuclease family protein [Rhodovibrio sp.]|nr:GIY-YIG nuclease family protein [Rhodovibrio sp.]
MTQARIHATAVGTDLPAVPGAYLLWLPIARPLALAVPKPGARLEPGVYLYFGSANGPGGLRARVARHLRADKRARWHVDQLTVAAGPRARALAWPGGGECAWREAVQAAGASVPVPRFGASDCRRCPAHLLRLDDAAPDDPRLWPGAFP